MERLRGFMDLAFDVVDGTTSLVERTHDGVVERSARRFASIEPARSAATVVTGIHMAISGGVFGSIRLINGAARMAVNAVADVAEAGLNQFSGSGAVETSIRPKAARTPSRTFDFMQSSINGFWGDTLHRRRSRLDLGMTLRHLGSHAERQQGCAIPVTREALAVAFPKPTSKICVFVHGLATTERLWSRSPQEHNGDPAVTFGTRLDDDLGYTPLYLRYNTGRPIAENGRALAMLLTEVLEAYPAPIDEIALVGHSMGGLVVRSAAHHARENAEPWFAKLRHVFCLGTPHLGAPLEKAVSLITDLLRNIDAAGAQVPAEVLNTRSAGIKDLRDGYAVDEEKADGVGYYFLAATISKHPHHPLGRLLGDLMVRIPSATGEAPEPAVRINSSKAIVFIGMNHVQLANHPRVYEVLRDLLAA